MNPAQKAVFLDRDGVLNKLVFNPATRAYESPHHPKDLFLYSHIAAPLKELIKAGYKLFIVSNQPSYAKGKTTLKAIKQIARKFRVALERDGVRITESFYCYHHPKGIVPKYTKKCACRKPEPFFLLKAQKKYNLSLRNSWMIGDRDSDVDCGLRAGCKTILVKNPRSADYQGKIKPDYAAKDLKEAVKFIIGNIKRKDNI
ncbi:MAG: HAD-IIIA family hydrolase [Planctomycetota bacterium]